MAGPNGPQKQPSMVMISFEIEERPEARRRSDGTRRSRKALWPCGHRGFGSHPLRQLGNERVGSPIESDVVVKPSVQTVAKIAKSLGVPMEELLR